MEYNADLQHLKTLVKTFSIHSNKEIMIYIIILIFKLCGILTMSLFYALTFHVQPEQLTVLFCFLIVKTYEFAIFALLTTYR